MNNNVYRDPTEEELKSELFESIWQTIKKWDISTEEDVSDTGHPLYTTATGNHVVAIMDAVNKVLKLDDDFITLIFQTEDGEETNVKLERSEYDKIVWNAGRFNMTIEDFINEALKREIEEMKKEE